jgi:hypothetical protein
MKAQTKKAIAAMIKALETYIQARGKINKNDEDEYIEFVELENVAWREIKELQSSLIVFLEISD